MDDAAVGAGKSLSFDFRGQPEFFFNRLTGVSELRSGGATDEKALNIESSLFQTWPRRIKKKS
jgi:hypothetical protein